ncbi:hypothetical protein [Beijerinckia mobilis]|uniref:hypothetical protein n=1 Tax=Beijerinckia mobilis TaxID=231434 RepID=UPI0005506864|nr:hypothetical protein [Beijerinckia mobilis]
MTARLFSNVMLACALIIMVQAAHAQSLSDERIEERVGQACAAYGPGFVPAEGGRCARIDGHVRVETRSSFDQGFPDRVVTAPSAMSAAMRNDGANDRAHAQSNSLGRRDHLRLPNISDVMEPGFIR